MVRKSIFEYKATNIYTFPNYLYTNTFSVFDRIA